MQIQFNIPQYDMISQIVKDSKLCHSYERYAKSSHFGVRVNDSDIIQIIFIERNDGKF